MKLLFFCTKWGHNGEWASFLDQVKAAGYDGVETSVPQDTAERETLLEGLENRGLQLIAQHWETSSPNFDQFVDEYRQRLYSQAAAKPLLLNAHTGKDYFTFQQNIRLLQEAAAIEAATGIPITHETHRGRFSFAAHITKAFLQERPDLKLTLDISHWCAVAESFLEDQQDAVKLALERSVHIHARVGYTQGPQVNDPRSGEWKEAVAFHFDCWDKIMALRHAAHAPCITVTPEFGPIPYMPTQPYSGNALSNQWEINRYMMELLRERYTHLY